MEAYADTDWAWSKIDKSSTISYCTMVGGNLVYWKSKKKPVVSKFSSKAEYQEVVLGTCELLRLRILRYALGLIFKGPTVLHFDTTSARQIVTKPVFHTHTKHFEVDIHFVIEPVPSSVVGEYMNLNCCFLCESYSFALSREIGSDFDPFPCSNSWAQIWAPYISICIKTWGFDQGEPISVDPPTLVVEGVIEVVVVDPVDHLI